jgi:hypothetical protein
MKRPKRAVRFDGWQERAKGHRELQQALEYIREC